MTVSGADLQRVAPWQPFIKPDGLDGHEWRKVLTELFTDCPAPIGWYPRVEHWLFG